MISPVKTLEDNLTKLKLPPDSAGANATHKVPVTGKNSNVGQVLNMMFTKSSSFDTINYIYVVGKSGRLVGVFSIKELFSLDESTPVEDIMDKRFVKVKPEDDQEKAVELAITKSIKSVPVVGKDGVFYGVVQNDKIISIFQKETREDVLKLAGFVGRHSNKEHIYTIWESVKYRTPWVLLGIVGGVITAGAIGLFDHVLSDNLILASFIPLVAYTANAVGNQAQTLFIRDLAVNKKLKFSSYLFKQLLVALFLASICLLFILFLGGTFWSSMAIGLIIGVSVFAAIMLASVFALLIPFILYWMKQDPAMGSGPFTTIIQDFLSIITYFLIASILL